MSHGHERKEKNCLNCGTIVQGRYCQACGQENIEPKETFLQMVTHFFNDITHFDGKFFKTLKILFAKPGFLSREYINGRRMTYLHPIRMYVFTSAVFFLVFFSFNNSREVVKLTDPSNMVPLTFAERDSAIVELRSDLDGSKDDTLVNQQIALLQDTSREVRAIDLILYAKEFKTISTIGGDYYSMAEYDSIQQSLPASERDGWFKKRWNRKAIAVNEKYRYNRRESLRDISDAVLHRLPYILFVSLPFFALLLRLLYIRRKQFYYADHGVFSIHHYILSFILLLALLLVDRLEDVTHWKVLEFIIAILFFSSPVYLFLAMRRFYGQGFFKTFIKFMVLTILGLIFFLIITIFFFLFSIYQL